MSRSEKKAGRRLNRRRFSKADLGDVTLNDFANSSAVCASGRMKKNSNQVNQVVKEVKQLNLVEDNQTWEKKLTVLEVPPIDDTNEETAPKKPNSRKSKRTVVAETVEDETGCDYPIDIWFLISEYIPPEDVGKFAAICKTTQAVVSTPMFWLNLYKRYYKSVANLPEQLQPECVLRIYGLRALVIRALHFMYPPFVVKLKPQASFDGDPHLLTKRLCVLAWSQKIKNHWLFSFKLKQTGSSKYGRGTEEAKPKSKPNLLEMLEDITANRDDKCKVLQVTCHNYINLPMLTGHILQSVSLKVSRGMSSHRLHLKFGSGPFPSSSTSSVLFDPFVNLRVLDWWHPEFPHSDGFNSNQQMDEIDF